MRHLLIGSLLFVSALATADTTVRVIVSNANMAEGENNFYVPTMFVNWNDELPVQTEPSYILPDHTNVTVFHVANWNAKIAQNTVINYQLQNDFYSSNCVQPASYFCTDSTCTTLKITMKFNNEVICEKS